MSELCNYEFEDVAWDEFCQSVDHIAPDLGCQRPNDHFVLGDNHKKRHREITSTSSNIRDGSAAGYVDQGREQGESLTLTSKRRTTMLETDTCSHTRKGDTIKEVSASAFDSTRSSHGLESNNTDSNGSGICENDAILGGESVTVDNDAFCSPLPNITHTSNNLDFSENAENKDSADFLHYGWPEIGNFEDIDGMLRGCDSAFGPGVSKEDDLGWFSSADDMGDVLKSDFKFSCPESNVVKSISKGQNSSKDYSIDASAITSVPVRDENTSSASENSDMYMSFAIGPPIADVKDGLIPKEKMNEHKKQFKLNSWSDRKSKEHHLINSFNHSGPVGVSLAEMSELDFSNVQERASSGLDDISLESAGFCQLQLVMKQLDLKTKLCMRDSLYRLARSAELRHNHENLNGRCGDVRVASGSIMAEGTNKCTNFMDVETDTNPIDRSIAHLLFHRSGDSSFAPGPVVCNKSACNG